MADETRASRCATDTTFEFDGQRGRRNAMSIRWGWADQHTP